MSGLEKLQSLFQDHVFTRDSDAVASFVGNAAASAESRLGVYYDAYRLRLVDCLQNDFPGLFALMGEEPFDALCRRYIIQHPSIHPNVRWFGEQLAGFLAVDDEMAGRPYLAEMARFEWARGLAFDAPDATVMESGHLTQLTAEEWPTLSLQLHPTVHRSQFDWNIGPIWRAVCAEESLPAPAKLGHPEQLALWRRATTVYWRSLQHPEARALDAFRDGKDFAEVCTKLCEWFPEDEIPAVVAGMLRQWVAEGLLSGD
jgi:hypothetical protein